MYWALQRKGPALLDANGCLRQSEGEAVQFSSAASGRARPLPDTSEAADGVSHSTQWAHKRLPTAEASSLQEDTRLLERLQQQCDEVMAQSLV